MAERPSSQIWELIQDAAEEAPLFKQRLSMALQGFGTLEAFCNTCGKPNRLNGRVDLRGAANNVIAISAELLPPDPLIHNGQGYY